LTEKVQTPNLAFGQCLDCNRDLRRVCPGFDWYSNSEIIFCLHQCRWIIEWLDLFLDGKWPACPVPNNYTDPGIRARYGRSSHAHFESPIQVAAEIRYRMKRCGVHGKLLEAEVQLGREGLSYEAFTALIYISGWEIKRTPYKKWLWKREKRRAARRALMTK